MTSWCPWPINIFRVWRSYFQVVLQAILKLCIWKEFYGNWGGLGTRFSCKLCWYSTEHDCWLNGFKSSRVQCIEWVSNHHVAVRYAVDMDGSLQGWFLLNNCPTEPNGKTWSDPSISEAHKYQEQAEILTSCLMSILASQPRLYSAYCKIKGKYVLVPPVGLTLLDYASIS